MKNKVKIIVAAIIFIAGSIWICSKFKAGYGFVHEETAVTPISDNRIDVKEKSFSNISIDKPGTSAISSNESINVYTVGYAEKAVFSGPDTGKKPTEETSRHNTDYKETTVRIGMTGKHMSPEEVTELYEILRTPSGHFHGMTVPEVAAIKNQVMDKVLEQQTIPHDFGEVLADIYRDTAQDVLVRNFAVQHFDLYANALHMRGLYDELSKDAIRLRLAINRAAYETDSSIAGSALLGMIRLSQIDSKINKDSVTQHAVAYAGNASINLQSRIAAVQICGELHIKAAIPALRSIIADKTANTVLRISAQHAILKIENND